MIAIALRNDAVRLHPAAADFADLVSAEYRGQTDRHGQRAVAIAAGRIETELDLDPSQFEIVAAEAVLGAEGSQLLRGGRLSGFGSGEKQQPG